MPGEVSQEIGRAYVYVFSGCLERAVKGFRQTFDVYAQPEKLTFTGFSGASYSFDVSGMYEGREVFIESKGYRDGSGILDAYKEFLAKAYCASVQIARHRKDHFWFVTNVPFGTSLGRRLWSPEFMSEALRGAKPPAAAAIIGGALIDEAHVRSLSHRIAVGIFTDSFIRVMGTLYRFRPGDTLWSATKLIHGGRIPLARFEPIAVKVQYMNDLRDPNRIRSGQRLLLPWFGMQEADAV
jgi:hypothetical protein